LKFSEELTATVTCSALRRAGNASIKLTNARRAYLDRRHRSVMDWSSRRPPDPPEGS
jgi:hypothetical protein